MGFLIAIVLALRAVRSLLPFLVVYASVGFFTDPSAVLQRSQERLPYTLGEVSLTVVALAALGRYLIGMWRRGRRKTQVRLLNAYLEAVWMTLALVMFSNARAEIGTRRLAVY
jgi:hypothetical protein